MTVLEVIQKSADFLTKKGVDSPRLQVELLLSQILKVPRMKLYLAFDRVLKPEELDALRELIKRRGNREPLQHIVGSTSFCGLEIKVSPDVLIPRPETEILAERGWKYLSSISPAPTALDFGTGSGCIAIALASHSPEARIVAVDVSENALKVAQENAAKNNVADRIEFLHSNGFEKISATQQFDLIVSNPPYIASAEITTLQPEVRDFDPRLALDGGTTGLDFYTRLAKEAPAHLKPGGKIMIEYGDDQAAEIQKLFEVRQWTIDAIERDYTNRERFLIATRPA